MAVPFAVVNAKGQMLVHYNVGLNITFTWNLSTEIQSSLTPFCCLLSLATKRISGNFRNSRPISYLWALGGSGAGPIQHIGLCLIMPSRGKAL